MINGQRTDFVGVIQRKEHTENSILFIEMRPDHQHPHSTRMLLTKCTRIL